ncbi:MAG: RNA-binding protein [Anaerolineae bacterium]|jgi:RNA recognition motif-containing protein|nr:RNA-binding protein [Anaerolineae bacterium]MDH7474455.1 RNA-binding protein [Anaerolineae bacterium]
MAKKLYVGNLSYTTTEDALMKLFSAVGKVESVNIITDRMSERSKGFGFVEMETEAAAQAAISQLNGSTVDDRQITVAEARPQRERSERGRGYGGGGGRRRY